MVVGLISEIATAFTLGLLTPLGAVCVLPLYPGFLVYLSGQTAGGASAGRRVIAKYGTIVSIGVILFMSAIGLIFTTVLQVSLTKVIGIVSPIAFGILVIISFLLILDVQIGEYLPQMNAPATGDPRLRALLFGLFFGAIVVPCNPLFIAALFARSASTANFLANIASFVFFGIGLAFPLLAFSLVSTASSDRVIGLLTDHRRKINLVAGLVMLVISLYYLFFVFRVLG